MPEDKEIRIRAILDNSQFDRGVQELQQKIQRIARQQIQGQGTTATLKDDTLLGKYAQQAFGDFSKESQRQLETMYQTQRREAVNQKINIREKQQALDKIAQSDKKLTDQQKERVKLLKEELSLMKDRHRQTIHTAAETKKALGVLRPEEGGAGGAGGVGGTAAQGRFRSLLAGISAGAVAKGLADAIVTGLGDVITRDRKITQARGAAAGLASVEIGEQFQGRGSRGMFFAGERARAATMAAREQSGAGMIDYLKAGGAAVAGGVAMGAAGSVIPGGGTALGVVGGGMAAFTATMLSSERLRARVFDQTKYRAMLNKEGMENYRSNLAANKAMIPRAVLAQQYLEQNAGSINTLQQELGLSDRELFGTGKIPGLLQNQIETGIDYGGTGFSQRRIQQQMRGLQAGGATTGGMRGLGGISAAYGRQLNLGNAAETLGQLSGTGLGNIESANALEKIMTKAISIGMDATNMSQEMKRMTAMTVQIATQGGRLAPGAIDIAMAGITGFDKAGVEAAGVAAGRFKQIGKAAGGIEGQMGFGFLLSNRANQILGGKKLSAKDMNYLNQFSYTEASDRDFQMIANYLDVTPSQAEELLKQKDIFKQTRGMNEEQANLMLGQFLEGVGDKSTKGIETALATKRGSKLFLEAATTRAMNRGGFMKLSRRQQDSTILLNARTAAGGAFSTDASSAASETLTAAMMAEEGRVGRLQEGAEGVGDIARIRALNDNIERLGAAAKAHTAFAEEYNHAFDLYIKAAERNANATDVVAKRLTAIADKLAADNPGLGFESGEGGIE